MSGAGGQCAGCGCEDDSCPCGCPCHGGATSGTSPRLGDPPAATVRQRFLAMLMSFEVRDAYAVPAVPSGFPGSIHVAGKPVPALVCKACGEAICDVDPGDTLSVLAGMALDHECPAGAGDAGDDPGETRDPGRPAPGWAGERLLSPAGPGYVPGFGPVPGSGLDLDPDLEGAATRGGG